MKREDFEIKLRNSIDCGWYIQYLPRTSRFLHKDLTLQCGTGWYASSKKFGEAAGYYHTKEEAEQTLNAFLETMRLPTLDEVEEEAKKSDEAALDISIRKWRALSEMPDEELKEQPTNIIYGKFCGLCARKNHLTDYNKDCSICCLFESKESNCCEEWRKCKKLFEENSWSKFKKAAKVMTERLIKEKGKIMNVEERIAQCDKDIEALQNEKKKLEEQKKRGRFYMGQRFASKYGGEWILARVKNNPVLISLKTGAAKNGLYEKVHFKRDEKGEYVTVLPTLYPEDFGLDKKYGGNSWIKA